MKVLISGAGIAGLSMARFLQEDKDNKITIIEKRKKPSVYAAGIALPANAVAALRKMGLGDKIDAIAHQVKRIRYTNAVEKVIAEASLLEAPLNLDKFVALDRQSLREILIAGVKPSIQFGTAITSIENDEDHVSVTLNNDPTTKESFDLVVAADGIHSELREKEAINGGPLKDLGVANWRFLIDCPTEGIEPTYQFGDTQCKLFMTYPVSKDRVYVYVHQIAPLQGNQGRDFQVSEMIKSSFSEFGGLAGKMLERLNPDTHIISGRLQSVPSANFYSKRVAFVGDAANGCSPILQQGAASAFEDTLTLAKMLKHHPIPKALEEYQSLRKPRVDWIIKSSDDPLALIAKMDKWLGGLLGSAVRNTLFRIKGPLNVAGWRTLFSEEKIKHS